MCRFAAIGFEWTMGGEEFQERLAEYACAVKQVLNDRVLYLNAIQHYQRECDGFDKRLTAVCPDVGIAASRDVVAVDAATTDLLKEASGRDIVKVAGRRAYRSMLAYGERLGLGTAEYDLIRV